jgi:hypothetical protein
MKSFCLVLLVGLLLRDIRVRVVFVTGSIIFVCYTPFVMLEPNLRTDIGMGPKVPAMISLLKVGF